MNRDSERGDNTRLVQPPNKTATPVLLIAEPPSQTSSSSWFLSVAITLMLVVVVLAVGWFSISQYMLREACEHLVFHPRLAAWVAHTEPGQAVARERGVEYFGGRSYTLSVTYTPRTVDLHVEHYVPTASESSSSCYTVLHCYSTNDNTLLARMRVVQRYLARGIAVVLWDYPGYGHSDADVVRPTLTLCDRAADTVYDFVVGTLGVDAPRQLIVHGYSLGAGIATQLAVRHPVAGLVLESAYRSLSRLATGGARYILGPDVHDNELALRSQLHHPIGVLVVHGVDDALVPIAHAKALFSAAEQNPVLRSRTNLLLVRHCDHYDVMGQADGAYWLSFDETFPSWRCERPASSALPSVVPPPPTTPPGSVAASGPSTPGDDGNAVSDAAAAASAPPS